ncbi:MAG: aminopeptidase P N-terminal domain-containing protein [Planctomycetota bacterium]
MLTLLTSSLLALAAMPQQAPEDGRGQGLFDTGWHAERREALLDFFAEKDPGVIVLRGQGSNKTYQEFRQDNNFWYFTGVTTPNAVLVMTTDKRHQILLVPEVTGREEIWNGNLIDPREAAALTGIEDCRALGANSSGLVELLGKLSQSYEVAYVQRQPAENWMMSRDQLQSWAREIENDPYDGRIWRERQFGRMLKEKHGFTPKDISVSLDAMRVVKTPEEVEAMRGACRAGAAGHVAAMEHAMPGDYEWQIAARMTYEYQMAGGMGLGGYAAIVASGINAITLHYNENSRQLQSGDVVMIDYGPEYNHYVADISRSWPVDRQFTEREREIYQAVYDAQEAAFKECKPGSDISRVDRAAKALLKERGLAQYMPHGTSHWLGMATHDVGARMVKFEPGMAFTVEPGVYIADENLGVRIEDIVVITEDGYELITEVVPRDVDEIEALRAKAWDRAEAAQQATTGK